MREYKISPRTAWWLLKARCANKPFVRRRDGRNSMILICLPQAMC